MNPPESAKAREQDLTSVYGDGMAPFDTRRPLPSRATAQPRMTERRRVRPPAQRVCAGLSSELEGLPGRRSVCPGACRVSRDQWPLEFTRKGWNTSVPEGRGRSRAVSCLPRGRSSQGGPSLPVPEE